MYKTKKTWRQYWLILKYYKFSAIATFLLTVLIAVTAAIKVERTHTVKSKIKLESQNQELINSLTSEVTPNTANNVSTEPQDPENSTINSAILAKQVFKQLKTSENVLETLNYEQFISKLDLKEDERTKVIEITYSGQDLNSSKLVVNSLIESFREQQAQTALGDVEKLKATFNQKLTQADQNAQEIASKLNNLLSKYDRNILEAKPEYLTNKIKEVDEKIASANTKIKEIDNKIIDLKSKLGIISPQDLSSNSDAKTPQQQKLLDQLQEIETQIIAESTRFSPEHPVITNLQADKAQLEAQIKNSNLSNQTYVSVNQNNDTLTEDTEQLINYEAEKTSLSAKVKSWETDKADYQKNAISPEIKEQYQELLAKNEQAQKRYNKLLNQSQQLEIFSEENITNIKIINPLQVKNSLASWNKEIITGSGIGLGVIFALATGLVVASRHPSLKNSQEISELFNTKVLGEIPNLKNSDFHISHRLEPVPPERFVVEAPYSVACEAYKIIYDNLEQAKAERIIKLITVSSSSIEEGKSTFIANLAALTTQVGKKVLIIDANIQTPKQKTIWQIDNNLGLTDILKKEAEFNDVVQAPSINLNVITAGSMIDDYLSLWESEAMKELIDRIQEQYDLVIFDTPAINLYPDALKISQFTTGIILVGRIGYTNPQQVLAAKELIAQSHQEILGLVVNDKFNS